jgi:hypothetical protein
MWTVTRACTIMHPHNKIYLWNTQYNNGNLWMSPSNNSIALCYKLYTIQNSQYIVYNLPSFLVTIFKPYGISSIVLKTG